MATIQVCDHCGKQMKSDDILTVAAHVKVKSPFSIKKMDYLMHQKEACSPKCAYEILAASTEAMKRLAKDKSNA
jgi:hypothetical protein